MIRVDFYVSPDGSLRGFSLEGHAGFSEEGSDIVCAAVSSAAYMAANTISEIIRADVRVEVEEGSMLLMVPEADADRCRVVLEGLKLHLTGLEEQYSDYINVFYSEV
jgi:uncharacterized protein YsxB (DUF464 family)